MTRNTSDASRFQSRSWVLQAGLRAKPKLGIRDAMELGIAGPQGRGRLPRTAAEVADPCWVIDKVTPI
jgi:hypothetical protein